jgi:tetratricopeptide (TPR) repeat protein
VERRHVARDLPSEALDVALGPAWNAIFVAGNRTGGLEAVDEALSRYPLSEIDPLNRPYLQLVILYGNASRLDRARELAAEWRAEVPEELRTDVAERAMQAQLALAEGRYEEAIRGFRANDEGLCLVCAVTGLALAYDRAGQADSAIASYERYVATTWPGKMYFDEQWLGRSYERLATLYDERGDLDNAARYYAMLAELWAEADPVLQPRVRAAQARLEEIVRARG